jgi:hypothetical protein
MTQKFSAYEPLDLFQSQAEQILPPVILDLLNGKGKISVKSCSVVLYMPKSQVVLTKSDFEGRVMPILNNPTYDRTNPTWQQMLIQNPDQALQLITSEVRQAFPI